MCVMTTNATVSVPESCRECGAATKVSTAEAILGDDGMLAVTWCATWR